MTIDIVRETKPFLWQTSIIRNRLPARISCLYLISLYWLANSQTKKWLDPWHSTWFKTLDLTVRGHIQNQKISYFISCADQQQKQTKYGDIESKWHHHGCEKTTITTSTMLKPNQLGHYMNSQYLFRSIWTRFIPWMIGNDWLVPPIPFYGQISNFQCQFQHRLFKFFKIKFILFANDKPKKYYKSHQL